MCQSLRNSGMNPSAGMLAFNASSKDMLNANGITGAPAVTRRIVSVVQPNLVLHEEQQQ